MSSKASEALLQSLKKAAKRREKERAEAASSLVSRVDLLGCFLSKK